MITSPAARLPIVAPQSGIMAGHFQRVMQALCEDANGLYAGAVSPAASLILDGIQAGRSLIRITFDLTTSDDGVALHLIGRTGAGVDVTANSWSIGYNDAATTMAAVEDTSDTQVIIAGNVQSDASTGGVHGEITISNIQGAGHKRVGGWTTNFDGSRERMNLVAGRIATLLPITGIKLVPSAGTITGGYARVDAP